MFFYVRLRTYAQYASLNEFTCSEHFVCIRKSKKRSTGNQPYEGKPRKIKMNLSNLYPQEVVVQSSEPGASVKSVRRLTSEDGLS